MATPLNKAVHRLVEIDGEKYLASLEPAQEGGKPTYGLRKMRTSKSHRINIESLIKETEPEKEEPIRNVMRPTHHRSMQWTPLQQKLTVMEEIKSKLTVLDLEYKLKVEILKTLEDIIEIEHELHSDSCTTNP
jgi:hypothetical protein|tara:strand:- start:2420 stop:2818 length:399 start_codon:yes stop_codon:yes gene_type:complete